MSTSITNDTQVILPYECIAYILRFCGDLSAAPFTCTDWYIAWKEHLHLPNEDFSDSFQKRYFVKGTFLPKTSEVLKDLFKRAYKVSEEKKFSEIIHGQGSIPDKMRKIDAWIETIQSEFHLKALRKIMKRLYQRNFLNTIEDSSPEVQINQITKWLQENDNSSLKYLTYNQLREVPPEIGKLSSLKGLYLLGNQLREVPPEIGKLSALTLLELANNQLREVPPEIGQLSALTWLNLSNNQLREVPPEIGQLSALTWLNLSNNQLREVPPEIGQLSNNQLREVPPEIGQLSALTWLEWLDLSNNQLTTLPPEICKLSWFPCIDGNPIIYLPSQLIPKVPYKYEDYAFDLDKDIASLERDFALLPVRLQMLIKRSIYVFTQRYHPEKFDPNDPDFGGTLLKQGAPEVNEAINWLKEKLAALQALRNSAISNNNEHDKLRILIEMMHYPTDNVLFEQQIAEAIIEVANTLPENSPLRKAINREVAKAFQLNLEVDPNAGFEKFTFRPLDPAIRKAVTLLASPQNAAEKSFYFALTTDEENVRLKAILDLFSEKDSSSMITMAIGALPLETKKAIKYQVHQITDGKNGDAIVMHSSTSPELKKAVEKTLEGFVA